VITYDTFCETRGCRETFVQQAESFDSAVAGLRAAGWSAEERDRGFQSHCPKHNYNRLAKVSILRGIGECTCGDCLDAYSLATLARENCITGAVNFNLDMADVAAAGVGVEEVGG
jgi:hypothetical protein